MSTPADATEVKNSRRCDCPGCGATLLFAADLQKLKCEYCDAEVDVTKGDPPPGPVERGLEEMLRAESNHGYGVTTKALQCKQCGAAVNFPDKVTSGACCFCGSAMVEERAANPQLITPESLIPFKVTGEQANEKFRSWVASLWFRPNDLKKMARVKDIDGVYAPFWTFDAQAETRWRAESGYHYYVTETYKDAEGKTQERQVQKTRWEPSYGTHHGTYDDLLVCASKGLSEGLVRQLEPYHTTKNLVGYQASYLSGWGAEEYAVGPKEAWDKGQKRFEGLEYEACRREVPGDTHRNLRTSMKLSQVTWKHCLLPVYVAAYRYHDKTYRFLVNGETGQVSGEAPYSMWKILFAILCVLLVIYLYFRLR
jgi:hypothetical protein